MTTFDDDLAALDHLLGPELLALLDRFEIGGTTTDDRLRRAERERHHELNADIASALVLVRRRLEHGLSPTVRDELTMPLPLADLGGH